MSVFVPVLAEVNIRAWGLDDPRVLRHLRYENQPGEWRRTRAVGARAADAGWPREFSFGNDDAKKALSETMRRLEGMDFSFQARHRRRQQRWLEDEGGEGDAALLMVPDLEGADRVLP